MRCEDIGVICEYTSPTELNSASTSDRGIPSARALQGQAVDERSDLYSAGCMLFELLTGRAPFMGDSMVSIAYQHVGEQPLPPSRFAPNIPQDLDAVVMHALAKPRDARYQSAGEFRSDLQAVRLGRPISAAARATAVALASGAGAAALTADATEALPAITSRSGKP